jgi:hypothetical protein
MLCATAILPVVRETSRGLIRGLAAACLFLAADARAEEFWKPFLAGAVSGLAIHEGSHLVFDVAFDADPRVKGVKFGPIPFFAITHRNGLPARQEALISGAGFLSQQVTSELVLSRRAPGDPASAFEKGLLAFHVATSTAYAGAAFARYGPHERDTRGIADATSTDERVIGALVLAPAAFDTWRYFRPESKAARWGSRLSKVAFLGVLLFKD